MHLSRRDLITPDEIMLRDQSVEILLQPGLPAMWAWKVRYYASPEFIGLFAPQRYDVSWLATLAAKTQGSASAGGAKIGRQT